MWCLTWFITALGAASVFLARTINQRLLDAMLGFAGGVMMAASYWSLLAPAIEIARDQGVPPWLPAVVGLAVGAGFLCVLDKTLPHLHPGSELSAAEGLPSTWRRSVLLVAAITIHNIPEGLAVGVAFGGAQANLPSATLTAAVALTIGIGLQNFPEGVAVAMPLRSDGMSRRKAFWYGQLSGVVEPVAAVLGAIAVSQISILLPYALSFAAGAMIYVVVEELIPESQQSGNTDLSTVSFVGGFIVMMTLDVALG